MGDFCVQDVAPWHVLLRLGTFFVDSLFGKEHNDLVKITNKFGLPDALIRAIESDSYSRGDSYRSITQLIDHPKIAVLRTENYHEMEQDASDMIWALLGKAVHWVCEQGAGHADQAEERLFAEVNGWKISGQVDLQHGNCISDYKLTSVWSFMSDKPAWEQQLNFYAWLVRKAKGVRIEKLQIVCIMRDWAMRELKTKEGYPPAPVQVVPIPVWSDEQQDKYAEERVSLHQDAEMRHQMGIGLPPCSGEDKWQRGDKWAVIRDGGKRASSVHDKEIDAITQCSMFNINAASSGLPPTSYSVQYRPGEPVRCVNNYCRVNQWCEQYREFNAKRVEDLL